MTANYEEREGDVDPIDRMAPFWFWNHELEEDELLRQLDDIASRGMGGVCIHARSGLKTPYMSDEWRRLVKAAVARCAELGLVVWLYDEKDFPSGLAAGQVIDANPMWRQSVLVLELTARIGAGQSFQWRQADEALRVVAVPLAGERLPADCAEVVDLGDGGSSGDSLYWTPPDGRTWDVFVFRRQWVEGGYYGYMPDYLNPEPTHYFISCTHQVYVNDLQPYLGTTVKGFFTDEPSANYSQGIGIPFTDRLPDTFASEHGLTFWSVLPYLVAEADGAEAAYRRKTYHTLSKLYAESYFKVIQDFCRANGLLSIGHVNSDGELALQAFQHFDLFELTKYLDYSGVDMLFATTWASGPSRLDDWFPTNNVVGCKLAASIGKMLGKRRIMSEAYGVADKWKANMVTLKRLTDWQLALGITYFIPHALYYSIQGERKCEWVPSFLQQPYWTEMNQLADYAGRYTSLLESWTPEADIAVLYPRASLWGTMKPPYRDDRLRRMQHVFDAVSQTLLQAQRNYDYVTESLLGRASIGEDGTFTLFGEADGEAVGTYRALVLPASRLLEEASFDLVEALLGRGIPVLAIGDKPAVTAETGAARACDIPWVDVTQPWDDEREMDRIRAAVERLPQDVAVEGIEPNIARSILVTRFRERDCEDGIRYLIHNSSDRLLKGVNVWFHRLSDTDKNGAITDSPPRIELDLAPYESVLVEEGRIRAYNDQRATDTDRRTGALPEEHSERRIPLAKTWNAAPLRPNVLPIREWTVRFGMKEDAIRTYNRHVYETTFLIQDIPRMARLVIDGIYLARERRTRLPDVLIEVNGHPLQVQQFEKGTFLDRQMWEQDVTDCLVEGDNQIRLTAISDGASTIAAMDDGMLLIGDFSVRPEGLSSPMRRLQTGSWTEQGYPYYCGTIAYEQRIWLDTSDASTSSDRTRRYNLLIEGVQDAVRVVVNGRTASVLTWHPYRCDITECMRNGWNEFRLEVTNTLHNMFGDHPLASGLAGNVMITEWTVSAADGQ